MQNSVEYNSERVRKDAADLISQADKIFASSSENKNELDEIRGLLEATGVPTKNSGLLSNVFWLVRKGCALIVGDEKGKVLEVCDRLEKVVSTMEKQNEDVRNVSLVATQLGNDVKTMVGKIDNMENTLQVTQEELRSNREELQNVKRQNEEQTRVINQQGLQMNAMQSMISDIHRGMQQNKSQGASR